MSISKYSRCWSTRWTERIRNLIELNERLGGRCPHDQRTYLDGLKG